MKGRPGTDHCFTMPIGVSGFQMKASSLYKKYQASDVRVDSDKGDGWCAEEADKNDDWLQVDLGKRFDVCSLATQGDRKGKAWVADLKLSYLSHGRTFTPYKDRNGTEVVRTDFLSLPYVKNIKKTIKYIIKLTK